MPLPNLLDKYGIQAGPATTPVKASAPKKGGIPNLITEKYNKFQEAPPAPVPEKKPGLLSRAGSAVTRFLAGATEAPVYNTGSKGELLRNLPGEIVRTILPGAAAVSDMGDAAESGNQDAIDTLTHLENKDVVKAIPKATFEAAVAPALSYPLTFYGATSQLGNKVGLNNAPGVGEDGRVNIKTPIGNITNVQERINQEPVPESALGTAAAAVKHTTFELLNGLFTASLAGKVVNPRISPITGEGTVDTKGYFPAENAPKTGQLYEPKIYNQPISSQVVEKITGENNIPVSRFYDPKNPVFFQVSEVGADGKSTGQFFQIKPSFMDVFTQIFKGDPTNVPRGQIIPIAQVSHPVAIEGGKPSLPVVPPPPSVPPTSTAVRPAVELPSKPESPAVAPVAKPQPTPKTESPAPDKVYRGYGRDNKASIYTGAAEPIAGDALYYSFNENAAKEYGPQIEEKNTSDLVKNPLVITDGEQWRELTKEAGWKYPNLVGLPADEVKRLTTSVQDLVKSKGHDGMVISWKGNLDIGPNGENIKSLRRVFGEPQVIAFKKPLPTPTGVDASLKDSLAASEADPARTPEELAKRIQQLNKFGQSQAILRKTGGVNKRAAGHFASGPKAVKTFKHGKVELRDETVQNPRQYMSTLAHELGHALEHKVTGTTNKKTYEVFGKNLTKEDLAKLKDELKNVTNNLVGQEEAESKPSYYYKPTEMLARFLESMFVKPGSINELAPTAMKLLEEEAVGNPIIAEYLEAVAGNIDKGELKHIFFRDMRQSFMKTLGTRNGEQAWNHVVRYRAMKERAKIQIEKLINEKFKNIKDDPALLFNSVESIKLTQNGEPEFGTRDFLNAKNKAEELKLIDSGYEPVMNDEGFMVHDLVDGKSLPRFSRERYTPEQGKAIFEQLSPEGKELVKDFTADKAEAKDYFNREVIKDVHKINSNIEGWVHHYWEDKPFAPGGPRDTLKTKTASALRQRKGAEGYVEDLKKAMTKSLTELETNKAYNAFLKEFFPRVTRPIAKGDDPLPGWVEVFGDIAKGGVGLQHETKMVVIKDGKTFIPEKTRYQMPKEVYSRFEMLRGLTDEATNTMRILNSIMRYWRVNILFHMGSNTTNFISGGLQYSAKLLTDFYSEVLTGNVTMPQTRSNIYAMFSTLTPRGWQDAPDWVYGGDQSNSYGQFTGNRAPGIQKLEDSIDAYADKTLKIYGLVERYWKKVIANAEGVSNLKNLNMITKEGLRLPTKEEDDLLDTLNREIDFYALDYDNVPVALQQYKRGVLGQALKPFAVFPYKITKLYTDMVQNAFDGTRPWQDRVAKILALGTLVAVSAYYIDKKRKEQETPAAGANTPGAVSSAGKVLIGKDEEGNEKFTRISKYPFVNLSEAALQASDGNTAQAWSVIRDMIGSVGPGGQIAAAMLGYKLDYQQYMTPDVIAGQALSAFVPGSRILNDIATYQDPYQRQQKNFIQGFTSFYPTSDPDLQEKLRGKIRTVQVPLEGGVQPFGDVAGEGQRRTTSDMYLRNYKQDILMQALLGIYIKRIDPNVAEAFNIREEKNALKKDSAGTLNPFYK